MAKKHAGDYSYETPKQKGNELERKIVENLIELQKINVSLTEKFEKLTKEISSLLSLFEMAARSLAEHPAIVTTEKDKEFLNKIDKLLEQNKIIAKGLTIMDEKVRERVYGPSSPIYPALQKTDEEQFIASPYTTQQKPMIPSISQAAPKQAPQQTEQNITKQITQEAANESGFKPQIAPGTKPLPKF